MTNEQIVQFIEYRAKKNAMSARLTDPKLILWQTSPTNVLIGIKYKNVNAPFMLRFTKNKSRCLFKLAKHDPKISAWMTSPNTKSMFKHPSSFVYYDPKLFPDFINHFVLYTIIKSIKTIGMGFDLFNMDYDDIELINPNESYEEIIIENDLYNSTIDLDF